MFLFFHGFWLQIQNSSRPELFLITDTEFQFRPELFLITDTDFDFSGINSVIITVRKV